MRRLRILHVVSSLQVGGMEQFVVRIAAAQREANHPSSILSLGPGPLAEPARRLAIPVRVLCGSHKSARLLCGLAAMALHRPQIVHAHNPTSLHYATLGKLLCGARVVMTDHGQAPGGARRPSEREWGLTDAVVAVSDATAQGPSLGAIQGKVSVIRSGVEATPARRGRPAVRAELGLDDATVVAIIVARLDGRKGHEALLRALAQLRDTDVSLRLALLIAGDGARRPELEALAGALGLTDDRPATRVGARFLGLRSDVPDLLAASDLFVLPSLNEGLPLALLEAMAHRLPVIATPVGGVPEAVLPGQTGLLVPVEDPQALAVAIGMLSRQGNVRQAFGEAGYERARIEFSFARMVERYEALYRHLRSRGRPDGARVSTGTTG